MRTMRFAFFILLAMTNVTCADTSTESVMTVKRATKITPLYYTSKVQPLKVSNIVSPTEGVLVGKLVNFGQVVTKGTPIFKMNSTKLESDYHTALSTFLQSKDAYNSSQRLYSGAQELYKLGIISEDDFLGKKSDLSKSYIAYIEALGSLEETIKAGKGAEAVTGLNISDYEKVGKALQIKYNYLTLTATADGILLEPPSGSEGGKIEVGSQVKLGQVLGTIGDMQGMSLTIKVSEMSVLRIKPGQKVTVTGTAFSEFTLIGKVVRIDQQASSEQAGGSELPTFGVYIEVPHLTPAQLAKIRVGMTAQVKIEIDNQAALFVPFNAVVADHNRAYLTVLQKDQKKEKRLVQTGITTRHNVEIKRGLSEGEKIIVPN